MQTTKLVFGRLEDERGRTIDVRLNEVLEENPDLRLESVTVLDNSEYDATLLCVFEQD